MNEQEGLITIEGIDNHTGRGTRFINRHLFNALILSFSFFLIFTSYSTTQNLESSLIPGKLGYWSLAALYAGFCVSALFFAAPLSNWLKPKFSLILGGAAYVPLIVANLWPYWSTMIPAAIILGSGAGLLWAAEGTYLTAAAGNYAKSQNQARKSAMGLFTGIFFCIFQMTQVVGNIIASVILMYGGSDEDKARKILFYTFLGLAVLGVLMFLFLGKEESESEEKGKLIQKNQNKNQYLTAEEKLVDEKYSVNSEEEIHWAEPCGPVFSMFHKTAQVILLHRDPRMFLMVAVMVYSGMEQSFVWGDFTSTIIKQTKGTEWIGFIMSVFGACDALSSVVLGKLADLFGKRLFIIVGFCVHMTVFIFYLVFLLVSHKYLLEEYFFVLFISAGLLGVADACWNTFPPIMMSVFFIDKTETAFASLKFWQSIGAIIPFIWGPLIPFEAKLIALMSVLTVACAGVLILDVKVASISATEEEGEDPEVPDKQNSIDSSSSDIS